MTISVAPRSELRDRLAIVVAATLRVPAAVVEDFSSFASLGMDSLIAIELTAAIENALDVELPLTAVHEYPTLHALCEYIERGASADVRRDQMLADAILPADIVPASRAHMRTKDARNFLLSARSPVINTRRR